MKNNHIILDVDGVILRSDKLYTEISKKIFNNYTKPSDFTNVITRGGAALFNTVAGGKASNSDIELFRRSQVRCFDPQKHFYKGVIDTLFALSKANLLSIVSNKPENIITNILEKAEIRHLFKVVIGLDSGFPKKPSPEGLLFVAECSPRCKTIFVGDSYSDYQTAKRANVEFIYCSYGFDTNVIKYSKVISKFEELL